MDQRSEEWYQSRVGRVGCSRLGDVCAEGRNGAPSSTRKNYMAELLCERLTGKYAEHWTSPEMQWGIDNEPLARSSFEAKTGLWITEDGGKEHPTIKGFGCSPDGLIGDDGGLEIKCPNTATHLASLLDGKINRDYLLQMAGGCLVYERAYWYFCSFDPRLPEPLNLYIRKFTREELPTKEVEEKVVAFLAELDELEKRVRAIA